MPLPVMSKAEPWIGSNIEGERRSGIDIAGGRDAEGARQCGGEIGQDVRVQIGGHHGVDRARFLHHARGHRVDQFLVPGDIGEITRDECGDLVPEHQAVALSVGFRHHGEVLARACRGLGEGIAHDPLDAGAGEDCHLGRHFLLHAAMGAAADAGVFALGILADDQPVEVGRVDVAQRAGDAGQDARRADIGVLVEPLADRQAQAPQGDVIGDVGVAHGPEIDRVRHAQPGQGVGRHEHAMAAVMVGAPIIAGDLQAEATVARGQRLQHFQAGVDHLRADPVAGDGSDVVGAHDTDIPLWPFLPHDGAGQCPPAGIASRV